MIKSFKVRLLPTKEQEMKMYQHIGSARFIFNYMLEMQNNQYIETGKHLAFNDLIKRLTLLKKEDEYVWLNNVSRVTLERSCKDMDRAFYNFFQGRARLPKYKSKKHSKEVFATREDRMYFNEDTVKLEKIGRVKYQTNYDIPKGPGCKFVNSRISHINNKWILSFGMEWENQPPVLTDIPMGIDVGIKTLATVAFGDDKIVFQNINKSARVRNLEKKRRYIQRVIFRKYRTNGSFENTKNIEKYMRIYKKLSYRIYCIRHDYLHKATHTLVSLHPSVVCIEHFTSAQLLKSKETRLLHRYLQDQAIGEFLRQIKYKCEWNGIPVVEADKYFPSSKTCSSCGEIKTDLKLSERTYRCPHCGLEMDRDYNAALNLMKYGVQH